MVHVLEEYAKQHQVPIMQKEGMEFLLQYIEENQVQTILEIGTAIGYSAIRMATVHPNIHVTTIERDPIMYEQAIENIKKFHLEKQITVIYQDAMEVEIDGYYDLIFIDAAKAQYIKFFEKFKKNLTLHGTIISDNLDFHGLVFQPEEELSKNVKGLVRKLKKYISFLKENTEFTTLFYHVGDGISISKRN